MFLSWFQVDKIYAKGHNFTYFEFPTKFVWTAKKKEWKPRKECYKNGRLTYIPPRSSELYYIRILLRIQKVCTNYDTIKTIDGRSFETTKKLVML